MQLFAGDIAANPLPADLMPANVSSFPTEFAFTRHHRATASHSPARVPTTPIKPAAAAFNAACIPRTKALNAVTGRNCPNEQP